MDVYMICYFFLFFFRRRDGFQCFLRNYLFCLSQSLFLRLLFCFFDRLFWFLFCVVLTNSNIIEGFAWKNVPRCLHSEFFFLKALSIDFSLFQIAIHLATQHLFFVCISNLDAQVTFHSDRPDEVIQALSRTHFWRKHSFLLCCTLGLF